MDLVWLLVVGLLFGGWFVLDGFNIGVGLALHRRTRPGVERRMAVTAIGPFLLANEVWLVATAGVLAGTFPAVEAGVLPGFYLVIVVLLVSWAIRDAGVWFRSRRPSRQWRAFWDGAISAGSLGLAVTAGLTIGNLLGGVPAEPAGLGLLDPLALLCAVVVTGLFMLHGAVFLALRLPVERSAPAGRFAARLVRPLLVLGAATTAVAVLAADLARPWAALAIAVAGLAAVALAGAQLGRGRYGRAFAFTAAAALSPVLAVGAGLAPRLLDGAAAQDSLERFGAMALPVIPVLLLLQAWLWWYFRRRVGEDSPVFF